MQRTRRGHEWVPSHAPATKARAIAGHKQCERPGLRVHDDGVRHAFRAHQRAQPVKEQARAGHQQHRDDLATHHRRCDADPRYGAHGHQHQYERHQGRAKRDHELIDEYGWCGRTVNALCGVRRRSWRTLRHGVAVDNERRGLEQDQHDAGERPRPAPDRTLASTRPGWNARSAWTSATSANTRCHLPPAVDRRRGGRRQRGHLPCAAERHELLSEAAVRGGDTPTAQRQTAKPAP